MDINGVSEIQMALQGLWSGVIEFLPKLIIAIVIFIIGWLIGVLVEKGIVRLIEAVKLDSLLKSAGLDSVLARGGFHLNSGRFIGVLVKWFVVLVFLVAAFDVVGLAQVNLFLREVVLVYVPNVIVAALILVAASIIANIVGRLVEGGSRAANVESSRFIGSVARWAIWIFAIIITLAQLGIATQFLQVLFTGIVAMIAIAGGLAFGLGGKEQASRAIDRLRDKVSQ